MGSAMIPCPECDGSGVVEEYVDVDLTEAWTCLMCDGAGEIESDVPEVMAKVVVR